MKFSHVLILALALFATIAVAQGEKKAEKKEEKKSKDPFAPPLKTADYVSLYVGIALIVMFIVAGVAFRIRQNKKRLSSGFAAAPKSLQSV